MKRNDRNRNRRNKNIFRLLCFAAALCTALVCYFIHALDTDLVVSYVDVGQGDSIYICTPDNFRILLDGGDEGSYQDVLQTFFLTSGVPKLDAAIVSHYHTDHASGIMEALEDRFPITCLYLPKTEDNSVLHGKLLDAAEQNGTEVRYLSGGDVLSLPDKITLKVILPDNDIYRFDFGNENNNSLLMKLVYGDTQFLFTGDMEADVEAALPETLDLRADVLKVGHHGSHTSTSQEFLERVAPSAAVIGVGAKNRYGHPHEEVLERLEKSGAHIYRTDRDGTVTVRVKKDGKMRVGTSR